MMWNLFAQDMKYAMEGKFSNRAVIMADFERHLPTHYGKWGHRIAPDCLCYREDGVTSCALFLLLRRLSASTREGTPACAMGCAMPM